MSHNVALATQQSIADIEQGGNTASVLDVAVAQANTNAMSPPRTAQSMSPPSAPQRESATRYYVVGPRTVGNSIMSHQIPALPVVHTQSPAVVGQEQITEVIVVEKYTQFCQNMTLWGILFIAFLILAATGVIYLPLATSIRWYGVTSKAAWVAAFILGVMLSSVIMAVILTYKMCLQRVGS